MLIEMLVATAIAGVLLGVLLQFATRAQQAVRVQSEAVDLQQRLRVAVESIRRDLLAAGAGPALGRSRGALGRVLPPVLPSRVGTMGADAELSFYTDRISIMYVQAGSPESRLLLPLAGPGGPVVIDTEAPTCASGTACGFQAGDRALIVEPSNAGGAYDVFTVAAADGSVGALSPAGSLSWIFPVPSAVVRVVQRVYYLDRAGKRLMLYDGDRSDLPLVDRVIDLRFTYFADPSPAAVPSPPDGESSCAYAAGPPPISLLQDLGGVAPKEIGAAALTDGPVCGWPPHRFDADLLRLRRIRIFLRLEAPTPGQSDLQATFDVVPRNLAAR